MNTDQKELNAVALVGNISGLAGSSGAWLATYTITGPTSQNNPTPPTNGAITIGMTASGPYLPAGTTVSAKGPGTQVVTLTSTLASATNPFQAATGAGLNFFTPPATQLSTYFNQAIDDFFNYCKNHPGTLKVEQNSSGTNIVFTGNVTTVLQFTGGGQTCNMFYPFFATNSPAGKTTPFGANVPPPPAWWSPTAISGKKLTQHEPPSQMVFGCDGVFADNTFQYPSNVTASNILGGIENVLVTALNRGTATSWQFLAGTVNATNPFSTSATITLTTGTTAELNAGMHVFSYQDGSIPMTIASIQSSTSFTVTSPLNITPTRCLGPTFDCATHCR